jgi:hypothetical protein
MTLDQMLAAVVLGGFVALIYIAILSAADGGLNGRRAVDCNMGATVPGCTGRPTGPNRQTSYSPLAVTGAPAGMIP